MAATQGLTFGWAARAQGDRGLAGAAMVGGSVGAALGLATAAYPEFEVPDGVVAGGIAAWGAWIGAFAGAVVDNDAHEVTLGGLVGANLGLLAGYGLSRSDWLDPEAFGWLSLFGAGGTVLGGAGAIFSTRNNTQPVLAGLAIGPVVGLTLGALFLPSLRSSLEQRERRQELVSHRRFATTTSSAHAARVSETQAAQAEAPPVSRAWLEQPGSHAPSFWHSFKNAFGVSQWMPFVGSTSMVQRDPSPPPMVFGLSGMLR